MAPKTKCRIRAVFVVVYLSIVENIRRDLEGKLSELVKYERM